MGDRPRLCAIDSNVMLRYLLDDNPAFTARAAAIMEAVQDGISALVIDPVAMAEVVWVMSSSHRLPNGVISATLVSLLQHENVSMPDSQRYLRALDLFGESIPHFGDACICALAEEQCDGRLYSFDRALSSVPGIHRSERPIK